MLKLKRIKKAVADNAPLIIGAAVFAALTLLPDQVEAAQQSTNGGMRLIKLMQKGTFWLGLGVSIWGVVEMQLDLPNWTGRILKGVFGYICILLLPLVFLELDNSLAVDVWEQIESSRGR